MPTFWFVVLTIGWVVVVLISSFMTLMMFAFADSPGAGKAAQKMIYPIFIIAFVLFAVSARLMWRGEWWTVGSAYALSVAPPFLVFLGYNLLMPRK